MKAIKTDAIIEGIRSRKDGSIGMTVTTPELKPEEKTLFFQLQGINVGLVITPTDAEKIEEFKIEADLDQKSQSTRMRNVLFILWKQDPKGVEFQEFYRQQMEKLIEWLKGKIEE